MRISRTQEKKVVIIFLSCDDAVNGRTGVCAVGCITEHPIFSTHRELTNEGFDVIIVYSNVTMFDIWFKQKTAISSELIRSKLS